MHLKLLDYALNNIQFVLPDILINNEKRRNVACLSMLNKILHNADPHLHYKLHQFTMPIRITWHTAQQNEKAFVLARYKTYHFYLFCFLSLE